MVTADIYNFDEPSFVMDVIESEIVVTGTARPGEARSVPLGSWEWVIVIQAINAEGRAVAPFIVVAGQYHPADSYYEGSLPGDWAIATTQNGRTVRAAPLEHFGHYTRALSNSYYRLLILDWYASRHSVDFKKYCENNCIITLCMPALSSHLLQPIDVGCFRPLKRAYGREIGHFIKCPISHVSKTDFFLAVYAAHQAATTESNINGGFREGRITPLDVENGISKLNVQLRTRTPAEEKAGLLLAPVFPGLQTQWFKIALNLDNLKNKSKVTRSAHLCLLLKP
ncbi:hypothetical protein HOO65_070038 [Ceratocystis lukuohia]|uniref:DDE-1 domain-containing protein n=1 Tax=Ceratocystis lukuohia TaxID=2019550 RepID=A0ABR4MBC2_9PEZI